MADGNGHQDDKPKLKLCPFWQKWCDHELQETCALHVEINKPMGGIMQRLSLCGFNALGLLLSEINQKTQAPPPQKINLNIPNIHRG